MTIYELSTVDGFNAAINFPKVIIDFYAPWCGPCKNISPVLTQLSNAPENKGIKFYKVNVEELEEISTKCGIKSLPTFMAFSNSKAISQMTGANADHLTKFVQTILNHN